MYSKHSRRMQMFARVDSPKVSSYFSFMTSTLILVINVMPSSACVMRSIMKKKKNVNLGDLSMLPRNFELLKQTWVLFTTFVYIISFHQLLFCVKFVDRSD